MGIRANIITKFTCEYGSSTFNYKQVEVQEMLEQNGVDVLMQWNADGGGRMEISTDGDSGKMYGRYLAKLEVLPPGDKHEYLGPDYTNLDVLVHLKNWWDYRDKKDKVIRVDWF